MTIIAPILCVARTVAKNLRLVLKKFRCLPRSLGAWGVPGSARVLAAA
jgi:hypothetical protein